MASLLCETVTGDTMAELLAARDAAAARATSGWTWWSCASTASTDLDVAGALARAPRAGDRDLPSDMGRRPV